LDRAPEVKTLRRRLTRLAAHHCAEQLGAELAHLRVDQRGHLMGFLYVDGQVRAYHGQRDISSKAYVARRHLAMPASTDYWINDRSGDPLLVITGEVNAALTKPLPRLLREVRDLVGEQRVTIVFDRGGWSPKLFGTMIKDGFDLLTYRKGRCRRINERRFIRRLAELDGRSVDYLLHDQPVGFLKGKLRLRQVTLLCDDGHQTQIITSRCDLRDIEVAYRMFERWRQENFFKYMREEFLLDALVDYRIEPEDPTRTIPNPERRALDKEVRAARADLAKLEREYGAAAADNAEQRRPTMRGFKIAHGTLGKRLRTARARVARLFEQRRDVAKRVEVRDLSERAVVKLATERKHLSDIIKMVAYQAESDLVMLLRPHYARVDQGEPCSMSCSPLQATSTSPIASCISPWLRSARRIERTPPRPSVRCSTKRRQSSPALACGFASQCVHHHVSGLPSPARQSSAAPPRLLPRFPDRRRNRTSLHYAMS